MLGNEESGSYMDGNHTSRAVILPKLVEQDSWQNHNAKMDTKSKDQGFILWKGLQEPYQSLVKEKFLTALPHQQVTKSHRRSTGEISESES